LGASSMSTANTSTGSVVGGVAKPVKRVGPRITRGLLWAGLAVLTLGGIGAVYQAIATANDRRVYVPPGQLVDIGGRRIHMLVKGSDTGRPTVILEAGMASFSSNFFWVQSNLAAITRVVAYDRAGLGWSDPAPKPLDAQESARDLRAALQKAGIQGPYVLAGHSYGGLVVRAFADLYPDEVVGMALIDASHPDQWAHIPMSREGKFNGGANIVTGFLARLGLVRLLEIERSMYAGLPARPAAEMRAILAKPESWESSGEVLMIWNERTRPEINQARSLGNLPLAVISVTEQPIYGDVLTSLQDELPALSSNSIHHTEAGATHENLIASREHATAVSAAIRQVLEAVGTGRPLSEISTAGRE
jgi:pimeloyl-ACP methyl ester carboxylesterase